MLMSTEHHSNRWDTIPRHNDLVLYQNDRPRLHKKGYKVSNSISYEDEDESSNVNDMFYDIFKSMPIYTVNLTRTYGPVKF